MHTHTCTHTHTHSHTHTHTHTHTHSRAARRGSTLVTSQRRNKPIKMLQLTMTKPGSTATGRILASVCLGIMYICLFVSMLRLDHSDIMYTQMHFIIRPKHITNSICHHNSSSCCRSLPQAINWLSTTSRRNGSLMRLMSATKCWRTTPPIQRSVEKSLTRPDSLLEHDSSQIIQCHDISSIVKYYSHVV